MLSRPQRLPSPEISRVMKSGTRIVGGGITLIYRFVPQGGIPLAKPRFTFIVSTKVDKRATVRNRLRRLMSESVRHLMDSIQSVDGVFIGGKQLIGRTQAEVETIVHDLLQKANLLKT